MAVTRLLLSPLPGLTVTRHSIPRLTPWAILFRRFRGWRTRAPNLVEFRISNAPHGPQRPPGNGAALRFSPPTQCNHVPNRIGASQQWHPVRLPLRQAVNGWHVPGPQNLSKSTHPVFPPELGTMVILLYREAVKFQSPGSPRTTAQPAIAAHPGERSKHQSIRRRRYTNESRLSHFRPCWWWIVVSVICETPSGYVDVGWFVTQGGAPPLRGFADPGLWNVTPSA